MNSFRGLAVALVLVVVNAATAGTITSGNASFTLVGPPVFASTFGDANLTTDPGALDQVFKYAWYYRSANNNQNRLFSSLDTPSETYVGDTATIRYSNAGPGGAGIERFNADFTIRLVDGVNPGESRVVSELKFTNINSIPISYQIFNLVDLDLSGTPGDDITTISVPADARARFTEGGSGNFGEVLGVDADAYQVGAGSTLRTLLGSGAGNLNNSAGPFNGDGAAAFQWSLTLQPGETATIYAGFALNQTAIPEPASAALLAVAALCAVRRRG